MLEGPVGLTVPNHKEFSFVACGIAPKQEHYPILKILETFHDLASLWGSGIQFQKSEVSCRLNICYIRSLSIVSKNSLAGFPSAHTESPLTFVLWNE